MANWVHDQSYVRLEIDFARCFLKIVTIKMHQMFFVPYVKIYILMTTMNSPHSLVTTILSIERIIDKVAFTEIEAL